ncbi:MAG: general secretion pathway protein E [Gammaproteobacteria bacterium]|jgi:general secretion pathway protein E
MNSQSSASGSAADSASRPRLGELLLERTNLDAASLQRALKLQAESRERIGQILLQLGMISERDLADGLAAQLNLPVVQAADYPDTALVHASLAPEFLRNAKAVPIAGTESSVQISMADPLDEFTRTALAMALGVEVSVVVGTAGDIDSAIQRLYGDGAGQMEQIVDADPGGSESQGDDVQQLRDLASEAPVIRIVNLVIARALELRASDIHIEPFENRLVVRYRVDGVLRDAEAPPTHSTAAVISRIKVLAKLNIAERRLPQDGRIKLRIEGREIDMRISTVPTMHGESVVMRILDKGAVPLNFGELGFSGSILRSVESMLAEPHGVILVTGPTGSGKTTTLYAALNGLNSPEHKILTVEDPVEYQLEGVNQIQVRPDIGLSFANALRSILRQDPDVIMVGEMRDLETAKIAVQAALTGHKVFSTLHTNDAASSITRLLDMGVEDYLVTSTVTGVIAQRLVRTLCTKCREPYQALAEFSVELGLDRLSDEPRPTLYKAVGCDACEQGGYRGRTTIIEVMPMTEQLGREVLTHADATQLRRVAREAGSASMRDDGLLKALEGLTSVEEVERATREDR